MAKSCIFKIIIGGTSGAGKTSFLNNKAFNHHNNDNYFHIGVNFKLIDCLVNNEDNYLLQIWDFKVLKDFQFLYPSFCKGAKGGYSNQEKACLWCSAFEGCTLKRRID